MPDPIRQLLGKAQRDISSLTLEDLEALRKFLDTQGRMRDAQRTKPPKGAAAAPMAGRKRRISLRYLPHLADIAAIFVECDRGKEPTARRCRNELGVLLRAETLRQWAAGSPEFRAAVEDAEIIAANAAKAAPEVRAPKDIGWLQTKQAELQTRHDEDELTDKERLGLRKEIREIMSSIRQEERHIQDLRDRVARRNFGGFLRRLVEHIKANHARRADVVIPILRTCLRSIDTIMRGAA